MADDKNQNNKSQFTPPPLPGKMPPNKPVIEPAKGQTGGVKPPLPGSKAPALQKPAFMPFKQTAPKQTTESFSKEQLSGEADDVRRQLETQMSELRNQLQEEREKLLIQSLKAKEEEALASKVEDSLKDIQDRLRREKREQELQESLVKIESHNKELEQRLAQERQTWVETLKTQLSQKENQERDVEHQFELRMKELERRWHEEKLGWSQAIKSKEQDTLQLKKDMQSALDSERSNNEKKVSYLENDRDSLKRELNDINEIRQEEKNNLISKLESRDRDVLSIKAQQAMLVTQVRQGKEKVDQFTQVLEKMRAEKNVLLSQVEAKDKEYFLMKTQFALYQTRAKSEQEKLLKEMVLYREHAEKDSQQSQLNIRSKEEEINLHRKAFEKREMELKQEIDKKEIEISSLVKQYEERMKNRENELKNYWDRKESDLQADIKQLDDRVRNDQATFSSELHKKEEQIRNEQALWSERIKAKDVEIAKHIEKNNSLEVVVAKNSEYTRELEDKVRGYVQELAKAKEFYESKEKDLTKILNQKETEFKNEKAFISEQLKESDRKNQDSLKKENDLNIIIAKSGNRIVELDAKIRDLKSEIENKNFAAVRRDNDFKVEKDSLVEKIKSQEEKLAYHQSKEQELNIKVSQGNDKISELEEKSARFSEELHNEKDDSKHIEEQFRVDKIALMTDIKEKEKTISDYFRNDNELRINMSKKEQSIEDLQKEMNSINLQLMKEKESLGLKEREIAVLSDKASLEKKNLLEQFEKEKKDFFIQISRLSDEKNDIVSVKEEQIRAIRQKYQDEIRTADMLKKDMESEVKLAEKEAEYLKKEIEKTKSESQLQENASEAEIIQKDSLYKKEISILQEKIIDLQRTIERLQEDSGKKLNNVQESMEHKVKTINSEREELVSRVESLREINRELADEKANASKDKLEVERRSKASEQELLTLKEGYSKAIKENQELEESLSKEIAALRDSMKKEIEEIDKEMQEERNKTQAQLIEKQKEVLGLQRQLDNLQFKESSSESKEDKVFEKISEATDVKFKEERERWGNERKELIRELNKSKAEEEELKKRVDGIIGKYTELERVLTGKNDEIAGIVNKLKTIETSNLSVKNDSNTSNVSVGEIKQILDEYRSAGLSEKETKSILVKIWENLNQPVIEITKRDK